MPKLSHKNIIALVRAFADVPDGGVCNGFTTMWALAETLEDEETQKFYQRLSDINDKYVINGVIDINAFMQDYEKAAQRGRNKEPLTEDDLKMFDIRALCEHISKQQDFFNKTANFELAYSKKLEEENAKNNDFVVKEVGGTVPKEAYADYLEAVRTVLQEHMENGGRKVSMLHGIGAHTVGLSYPGENGAWKFMDINRTGKDYDTPSSSAMANFMLQHYKGKGRLFSSIVDFNLTLYAKGDSTELIEKLQAVVKEYSQPRKPSAYETSSLSPPESQSEQQNAEQTTGSKNKP